MIGSIRTREVESKPYMQKPRDWREVSAHLAALSKQSGNGVQSFFSAACNDDRFLDLDVVDGTSSSSG